MMLRLIAKTWLLLTGWKTEGDNPPLKKYVVIAAPHTTNWDFPHTMAVSHALGAKLHWLGKRSLFRFPLKTFFLLVGGIPVDRSKSGDLVGTMAAEFAKRDEFKLIVAAEGTRGKGEYWKSGFYHIARRANVPVVLGWLDYGKKSGGLTKSMMLTGNVKADMDEIRAFYQGIEGKYPHNFTVPRLREEDIATEGAAAG